MTTVTGVDRAMAKVCVYCPVCRHARKAQTGMAFTFVKAIESRFCPFCRAYGKVCGKAAHEPR
jgi:hypothetical protein